MGFDWQTDEHGGWEQASDRPPAEARPGRRRRLAWLGVLAVIGITALLFWWIRQRAEAGVANVEAEIVASHTVIQESAERHDQELFLNFLSGRDAEWATALATMVAQGSYHDRSAFGLKRLAPGQLPSPVTVRFMPDLKSAELAWHEFYAVNVGNGLTETIRLRQESVFRFGPGRWLLAPPEPSFWGGSERVQGQRLAMSFPARDGDLGQRLALDMDNKLAEMCSALPELGCPPGLLFNLSLSTDPSSVAQTGSGDGSAQGGISGALPTPTLLGLPEDEAAYRAVFRGYASLVSKAVANRLLGFECCRRDIVQEALLAQMLDQLSLQPAFLGAPVYRRLAETGVTLADVARIWAGDGRTGEHPGEEATLRAFIQFLADGAGMSVARAARALGDELDFWEWLRRSNPGVEAGFTLWERQWRMYLAKGVGRDLRAVLPGGSDRMTMTIGLPAQVGPG
jgi:hypothetical protein